LPTSGTERPLSPKERAELFLCLVLSPAGAHPALFAAQNRVSFPAAVVEGAAASESTYNGELSVELFDREKRRAATMNSIVRTGGPNLHLAPPSRRNGKDNNPQLSG